MTKFKFCKHAKLKFKILRDHGFIINRNQVIDAIKNSDKKERGRNNRIISQKIFDEKHVLRVIYEKFNSRVVIITFYPGRRSYYES